MAFVGAVPVDQATGEVRAMYERNQARLGYVPNYAKAFSHRPGVWTAWETLVASIRSNLDARRYELVTLAAARALRSSYCSLAHGRILRERFYSAGQMVAIAEDYTAAQLGPADVAIMKFAEKVAGDASAITEADVQALRDHGLSDSDIFDVASAAAARCFFGKLLDAVGAEPDSAYTELDRELRRHLTVGRAIATSLPEQVSPANKMPEPGHRA
jgi:uncharacterized peroxidase-related enzyme